MKLAYRFGLKTLLFASVLGALFGCSSQPAGDPFQTRLYVGAYDEVWLAALKALSEYPLKVSNKDAGRIQTETVNGPYNELLMTHPEPLELPERYRYSLEMTFAKLATDDSKPLTRVRVRKTLERFHDFYTGWLSYPADGLEEKVLLYRMEHILQMERALSSASF